MNKKFFAEKISALFIALFISSLLFAQENVNADKFQQLLDSNVQLLDVRTASEYQSGHIKNALQADWTNKEEFQSRVQALDKTKPLLVYCASGGRSSAAAKWFAENGFTSIYNLQGGFIGWKENNKPVENVSGAPEISIELYEASVKSAGSEKVLVDFGAVWCPPCKKMEPVINQLQNDLKDQFALIKVDAGAQTNLMSKLNVQSIPTFILYKNGKEVWRKEGIVSLNELQEAILK